jgi:hypothetical protein
MSKEQEIYKNMKKKGRIYKAYGKWGIDYASLYCSIKEAGYDSDAVIWRIINGMMNKGYIRLSKNRVNRGLKYVVEKWVN